MDVRHCVELFRLPATYFLQLTSWFDAHKVPYKYSEKDCEYTAIIKGLNGEIKLSTENVVGGIKCQGRTCTIKDNDGFIKFGYVKNYKELPKLTLSVFEIVPDESGDHDTKTAKFSLILPEVK